MTIDEIFNVLMSLKHSFQPNELAYYHLTSKSEHLYRDKFSWLVHNGQNNNVIGGREAEGCRIDSVIYEEVPLSPLILPVQQKVEKLYLAKGLIEFKLRYSFDIFFDMNEVYSAIEGDFIKLNAYCEGVFEKNDKGKDKFKYTNNNPNADKFVVLIIVHPKRENQFGWGYERIIAYREKHNKFIREIEKEKRSDTKRIAHDCNGRLVQHFSNNEFVLEEIKYGHFEAGNSFDTDVDIIFWIMKK